MSRTVPIVFAQNIDPVGSGNVESLAQPGTNATGFTQFEYSLSAKWLELLERSCRRQARGGLRDIDGAAGIGQWAVIQSVARPLGVELTSLDPRDARGMERAHVGVCARSECRSDRGGEFGGAVHRELIVALAARHQLPAVYPYRYFVAPAA